MPGASPIVFPERKLRAAAGKPPLSALVWGCAKVQKVEPDPMALMRIQMAERSIPPALALALRLRQDIDPEKGLGSVMRKHGLVPGLANAGQLDELGGEEPSPDNPQAAWERWAAGLMGLSGHDVDEAGRAARMLAVIEIGCRPAWRQGYAGALWTMCWERSPYPPPPNWAPHKPLKYRSLRAPQPRKVAYA